MSKDYKFDPELTAVSMREMDIAHLQSAIACLEVHGQMLGFDQEPTQKALKALRERLAELTEKK